jgi:hypothetical protein
MKFAELKLNWDWFLRNMPDNEPISFPRREAKKRMANKEKKSEVRFKCDPVTYGEFHVQKERIMRQLDENPTLFGLFVCETLSDWRDEAVAAWKRNHEGIAEAESPTLGDA